MFFGFDDDMILCPYDVYQTKRKAENQNQPWLPQHVGFLRIQPTGSYCDPRHGLLSQHKVSNVEGVLPSKKGEISDVILI